MYVGYHSETLLMLNGDDRFELAGTGLIGEFMSVFTLNPVNILFKLIYGLRCSNRFRLLERALLGLWNITSLCSSSFYFRYRIYLKAISQGRTKIVDVNNKRSAKLFIELNAIDLMVVCAWTILPEEIIALPAHGSINIHPSKLPRYRGALPTLWSLKNGDSKSAVSYVLMDNTVIDGGGIVAQHEFPINSDDDWHSLELKINEILRKTLLSDLAGYFAGIIKPAAQEQSIRSSTGKSDGYMKIQWDTESGKDIYNKINLYPFLVPADYCYTYLNGRKVELKKAVFIESRRTSPVLGSYHVQGLTLSIQARCGIITCSLFSGLRCWDSIYFILHRKGNFI